MEAQKVEKFLFYMTGCWRGDPFLQSQINIRGLGSGREEGDGVELMARRTRRGQDVLSVYACVDHLLEVPKCHIRFSNQALELDRLCP